MAVGTPGNITDGMGLAEGVPYLRLFFGLLAVLGAMVAMRGRFMIATGTSRADIDLRRRGAGVVAKGLGLGVCAGVASAAASWLTGRAGTSRRAEELPDLPATARDGGALDHLLAWGGIGLGALVLVAVGSWGAHRLRKRRAVRRRRWQALKRDHDAVATAYGDYLADVLAWLDRPTLNDVSVPETATLLHALDAADDARRGGDAGRYQETVAFLRTAWKAADDRARTVGLGDLPPAERRAAEQARKLLATALDTGTGSEHERRSAYAKARSLLDGILVLPPKAIEALEATHRLALTSKLP
ncbi:DUF2786 domain-containing protein [Streptomyces sp. NPDC001073]